MLRDASLTRAFDCHLYNPRRWILLQLNILSPAIPSNLKHLKTRYRLQCTVYDVLHDASVAQACNSPFDDLRRRILLIMFLATSIYPRLLKTRYRLLCIVYDVLYNLSVAQAYNSPFDNLRRRILLIIFLTTSINPTLLKTRCRLPCTRYEGVHDTSTARALIAVSTTFGNGYCCP